MEDVVGVVRGLDVYQPVGIRPEKQRYLLLKSRMYYRPVFLPIARGSLLCDGVGVASSDWTQFTYRNIRRPIYPLDEGFEASQQLRPDGVR